MQTTLILASTSPRRIDLMKQVGLSFSVESPDADETPKKGESPRALVTRLSREKALSIAKKRSSQDESLIIAADTIVVAPGGKQVLGKPRNEAEARKMLAKLSGDCHAVLTGYCILKSGSKPFTRVVTSRVKMRKLSRTEIECYVKTGEPMDKAGSYAAQGLGMALVESIQGSYTNVVGLPMCQLIMDLEKNFGIRLFR